jgi:sugar-phosphatase
MKNITIDDFDAVIFDMDGVLIDSEPVWKIAMEEVFASVNCNLTRKDFEKTVGLRLDEVIHYWYKHAPWENATPEAVLQQIIDKMVFYLSRDGQALEGVKETLQYLAQKEIKIGLATSSYEILIETVLDKLEIKHFFQVTHSAERENFGKPHPAVYISCAQQLEVHPLKCLVIEDSINGVISGKAARMTVVCIPEKSHNPNPKLMLADFTFASMNAFLEEIQKN